MVKDDEEDKRNPKKFVLEYSKSVIRIPDIRVCMYSRAPIKRTGGNNRTG